MLQTGDAVTWLITAVRSCLHDYCGSPCVPFMGSRMQQDFFKTKSSVQDHTSTVLYFPELVETLRRRKFCFGNCI